MSTHAREAFSNVVLQRIYSEFLEMLGLRLTWKQAQRLWGLDAATCLAAVIAVAADASRRRIKRAV
jgi:hypothetical protein